MEVRPFKTFRFDVFVKHWPRHGLYPGHSDGLLLHPAQTTAQWFRIVVSD
jgi:hypothetical protein